MEVGRVITTVIPTEPRGERRNPFPMTKQHNYYTYILASDSGTLYIGVTNNLERRISEHQQKIAEGFTKKYNCNKLVYYEHYTDVRTAIERETQLKKWRREKKEHLIAARNPTWSDLSAEWEERDSSAPLSQAARPAQGRSE